MNQKNGKKMPKINIQPCPLRSVISPTVNKMIRYNKPPNPMPHHTRDSSVRPTLTRSVQLAGRLRHHPAGMRRDAQFAGRLRLGAAAAEGQHPVLYVGVVADVDRWPHHRLTERVTAAQQFRWHVMQA